MDPFFVELRNEVRTADEAGAAAAAGAGSDSKNEIIRNLFLGSYPIGVRRGSNPTECDTIITVHETDPQRNRSRSIDYSIVSGYWMEISSSARFEQYQAHFEHVFPIISKALKRGEKVLIHCEAGQVRSANLTAAYLIYALRITAEQAIDHIKKKRASAEPDLVSDLEAYQIELGIT